MPRHCWGGAMHRGGLKLSLSHRSLPGVAPQQPLLVPELHVSPVGRQRPLASSIAQRPPWQMSEQHSAFVVHVSPCTMHSRALAQTPPKQPSEQQS